MERAELYAVLISLNGDTLLLPNAAVAEVVSAERIEKPAADAVPWFAGRVTYNNRAIPVVRFEVLNGGAPGTDTRRTRLAVIQAVSDRVAAGQYAIVCQGYPHLVTLNRSALQPAPLQPADREALALTRVAIANTNALIPNLEALEQQVAAVEAVASAA